MTEKQDFGRILLDFKIQHGRRIISASWVEGVRIRYTVTESTP